jgi:hypothetical protein
MARALGEALGDPERRRREIAGREAVKAHTYAARAARIMDLASVTARRRRATAKA